MTLTIFAFILPLVLLASPAIAAASELASEPAYGVELEGFAYPEPVRQFAFSSQRQQMHMAYMDVQFSYGNESSVNQPGGSNSSNNFMANQIISSGL